VLLTILAKPAKELKKKKKKETLWSDHVVTGNAATMMEPGCVQRHLATP
jgi:hypothetical protein